MDPMIPNHFQSKPVWGLEDTIFRNSNMSGQGQWNIFLFPPKLEPLHVRHDMLLAFPCLQSGKCREDWFDQTKAKINWTKNISIPWKFPYFCLHCPRNPMRQDQPPQFSSPCHCPARQNFLSEILQYFKRNSIKDLSRNEEIMNNNRRENFWFRVKIAETEKSIFLTTDRYFRLWKKGMQWRC